MTRALSLRTRALLAIALLVGFYALALGMAIGLLYMPWAEWTYLHRVEPRLAFFCAVGAFLIARSVVPRRDRFEAPGPRLTAAAEPRLFAVIDNVARATGQAPPAEVYLIGDVNAWVAERGGMAGAGSRRVMGIGLPLLEVLTVGELRAVIAHEFGHYVSGDTRLGPWVYRTHSALERTFGELSRHSRLLAKPIAWYGKGFLRVTHAVSRAQEFVADATAAGVAGREPLQSALRKLAGVGSAYGAYWRGELAPVLELGFRPPLATGFRAFLSAPTVVPQLEQALERTLAEEQPDHYDTHPTLRVRLAALDRHPASPAAPGDAEPAIGLLSDVDAWEAALIVSLVRESKQAPVLTPIAWEAVPATALAAGWRQAVSPACEALVGLTPEQLPALLVDARDLAVRVRLAASVGRLKEGHVEWAASIVGSALALALLARTGTDGLRLSAPPGEPVRFTGDAGELLPFAVCAELNGGALTTDAWRTRCDALGLTGVDLGAVAMAAAAGAQGDRAAA